MSDQAPATTIIRGATVVTMDAQRGVLRGADIVIRDGLIADVVDGTSSEEGESIDGTEWIVIPGFVDTHRHTWQSAIRHTYGDVDPLSYFREVLAGAGTHYLPQDVYAGTLLGSVSALSAGTTTLLDWAHIQNSPAHADAGIDALRDAGIRAVYGHGWPLTSTGEWTNDSALRHPRDVERLTRTTAGSPLLHVALAARGPEMASADVWRDEVALARELGIRISVHVGAYRHNAAARAVAQYHRAGLLADDMTFVHCSNTSTDELSMIADAGATVSLGVHCELNAMGIGDIPLDRLLSVGIRPSLSGDTETKCSGDMFTQMRALFGYYRSWVGGGHSGVPGPHELTLHDVLEFATLRGAHAVGLGHHIGSITPGKAADLVCIRATDLNIAPVSDPVATVVLGAHEGNVDTVFVAGRRMKSGGRMLHADAGRIVDAARTSQNRLASLGVGR
ncbi:amidohydrolase family protein [Microbacterium hydrocarbonoxydans]|uniref:amidohydrolase family protein n=1 Tax=Microbacterium hydrocarbonoxydans TaxID=273678 RepID=UPI0007BC2CEB|nr:amidohydrolase family protein [Microbacterium hydrocarbonoxydans]GAT72374.1 hypothetical protein MHM582_0847 [Microbacterium sp. HM58-2]